MLFKNYQHPRDGILMADIVIIILPFMLPNLFSLLSHFPGCPYLLSLHSFVSTWSSPGFSIHITGLVSRSGISPEDMILRDADTLLIQHLAQCDPGPKVRLIGTTTTISITGSYGCSVPLSSEM